MVERAACLVQWFRAVPEWERRAYTALRGLPAGVRSALHVVNLLLGGWEATRLVALLVAPWWPLWAALVWATAPVSDWAKELAQRDRPTPGSWGFPSGDVAAAVVFCGGWLGWWAAPLVVLVAIARVANGFHWPLDTLGGALVGLLLLGVLRG